MLGKMMYFTIVTLKTLSFGKQILFLIVVNFHILFIGAWIAQSLKQFEPKLPIVARLV
jgi:hypothetical protein